VLICYLGALLIVDHVLWQMLRDKCSLNRGALSTQRQEQVLRTPKDAQLPFPICVEENPFFHICTDLRQQHKMHNQPA